MFMQPMKIDFKIPQWIDAFAQAYWDQLPGDESPDSACWEQPMRFVIAASKENVVQETGGPFAAAIFEQESKALVSLGVNLVTTGGLSILHAELVALTLAQQKLKNYDLGSNPAVRHVLVSSTEPCAMCFGAIPWSGVSQLVTGAQAEDACAIGFDEGPRTARWSESLETRGIQVITRVEREAAQAVLNFYQQSGGTIYNSRQGEGGDYKSWLKRK